MEQHSDFGGLPELRRSNLPPFATAIEQHSDFRGLPELRRSNLPPFPTALHPVCMKSDRPKENLGLYFSGRNSPTDPLNFKKDIETDTDSLQSSDRGVSVDSCGSSGLELNKKSWDDGINFKQTRPDFNKDFETAALSVHSSFNRWIDF
ncbi:Hypothetical predicted protein [Scomber scombrus]|uniref:Uncharacterized protein n=1 Tax=Scomber scombrus TaxID=13677 RepID=A0AAV1PVM0_SCOSC